MDDVTLDNVPVHVRTTTDSETGERYVHFGIQLGDHFVGFHALHLDALEHLLADLEHKRQQEQQQQ